MTYSDTLIELAEWAAQGIAATLKPATLGEGLELAGECILAARKLFDTRALYERWACDLVGSLSQNLDRIARAWLVYRQFPAGCPKPTVRTYYDYLVSVPPECVAMAWLQYVSSGAPVTDDALRRAFRGSRHPAYRLPRFAKKTPNVVDPLFELMDLPESFMTECEIAQCDAYVADQTAAIRAAWTPAQEARARGVGMRYDDPVIVMQDGSIQKPVFTEISNLSTNGLPLEEFGDTAWRYDD